MFRVSGWAISGPSIVMACAAAFVVEARDPGPPNAASLLAAADAVLHALDEGVIRVRATMIESVGGSRKESTLDVYVEGPDKALCIFREGLQANRRILVVGDRVWLMVPGTARPISITPQHRLFGGASVADLAHLRLAKEFTGSVRPDFDVIDSTTCQVVDLIATSRTSAYARGTLWIGRDDGLPRRLRLTLPSGKEAKEIDYAAYRRVNGRTALQAMEVRHLLRAERGMITRLQYLSYEPRALPSGTFDPDRAASIP